MCVFPSLLSDTPRFLSSTIAGWPVQSLSIDRAELIINRDNYLTHSNNRTKHFHRWGSASILLSPIKFFENHDDAKNRSLSNSGHSVVIYLLMCVCVCVSALNTVNGDFERDRGHSANKSSFFSVRKEAWTGAERVPEDVSSIHKPCLLYTARMHAHARIANLTDDKNELCPREEPFLHSNLDRCTTRCVFFMWFASITLRYVIKQNNGSSIRLCRDDFQYKRNRDTFK